MKKHISLFIVATTALIVSACSSSSTNSSFLSSSSIASASSFNEPSLPSNNSSSFDASTTLNSDSSSNSVASSSSESKNSSPSSVSSSSFSIDYSIFPGLRPSSSSSSISSSSTNPYIYSKPEDINDDEYNEQFFLFELLEDDTYQISAISTQLEGDIYIPETYKGKAVTTVKERGFYECKKVKSVSIPDSITTINKSGFNYTKVGNNLSLSNNLVYLGEYSFLGSQIEHLTIGNGLKDIPAGAFVYNGLEELIIPDTVEKIGHNAFSQNSLLKKVHLGKSLKTIEGNPFVNCYDLKEITVDSENDNFFMEDSILYSKDYQELILLLPDKTHEEFIVPDSTEIIHAYAFCKEPYTGNSGVKKLTLGKRMRIIESGAFESNPLEQVIFNDCLTTIESHAFSYTGIKELTIPDTVTFIGDCCFQGSPNLEKIKLPNALQEIPKQCFYKDEALVDIVIPHSVEKIGYYVFFDSANKLTYSGTKEEWSLIEIDQHWTNHTMTINCLDGILTI